MSTFDEGCCYEINAGIEGLGALGAGILASREAGHLFDGMKFFCEACPHPPF